MAFRRVSRRRALVACWRVVAEAEARSWEGAWARTGETPVAPVGVCAVVSWTMSRRAARDWVWSSSWMASRRAAWTFLMWLIVRWYWSLCVRASSWSRVMLWIWQMVIGERAGLSRSSRRGSVRGGGAESAKRRGSWCSCGCVEEPPPASAAPSPPPPPGAGEAQEGEAQEGEAQEGEGQEGEASLVSCA